MPENNVSPDEKNESMEEPGAETKVELQLQELQDTLYHLIARSDEVERAAGTADDEKDDRVLVIDLQALLFRLIEKWSNILFTALLGAVLMAFLVFYVVTPMYEATSKLYVLSPNDSAVNLSDLQIGTYLTSDYQEVFSTWEVHQQVIDNLGLEYTYEETQKMVTISNPSDTRILHITVKSDDPQEATDMANEYANVARAYIGVTMKTEEPMIMSVALKPLKPVSPRKALDILLGFLIGGFIAAGIVCVQFIQDDKTKTAEEIMKFGGMTTLAVVPAHESDNSNVDKYGYGYGYGGGSRG